MGLFHRKILPELIDDPDKKIGSDKKYESCDDCYNYLCPDECKIYPSPPPPPPRPNQHHMSIFLTLVICFLGAGLICFSYIIIRRYRLSLRNRRRRRDSSPMENNDFREDFIDENQGPVVDHHIWYIRTVGLPQSVIDSIPMFNYRREEKLIDGSDCSVCLNEFEENESLRLLPKCSHAFHVSCIDTWLRSHKNCPVCRSPISTNNTNTSLVNTMEISSSNSGSREENELENRPELGTGEITEMRELTENAVGFLEDDKMAELFSKNCSTNSGRNGRFRVVSDLADHRVKVDQELEPVRRSVSMDNYSGSMICNAVAEIHAKKDEGCSDNTKLSRIEKQQNLDLIPKMGNMNSSISRLIKSSSYRILLQKGPISMQRSFSFSGKYSLTNQ